MTLGRVLVADDEGFIRELVREFLESRGYTVDTTSTTDGLIPAVRENRPDVVLLDLHMPGDRSGGSIIRELSAETSAVVMTGAWEMDLVRRIVADGAIEILRKPFNLNRLAEVVEMAMRRSGRTKDEPR